MICTVIFGAEYEVAETVGNEMSFVYLEFYGELVGNR
jgi:hypothetical protein